MLVKSEFEGIAHFANHPEMLPHMGLETLVVDECTHLPGKFFAELRQVRDAGETRALRRSC